MQVASLDNAEEPLRVVARADAESLSAAIVLFAALRDADKKACLSVIRYNDDALKSLLLEDYGSFVFLNCALPGFKEKFAENGIFLGTKEAYGVAKNMSPSSGGLAHIIVAGIIGEYLKGNILEIDNGILNDALRNLRVEVDGFAEIDEQFLQKAVVKGEKEVALRFLFDVAELLNACIAFDKPSLALAALISHGQAKDEAATLLTEYKKELSQLIEWCRRRKGSSSIVVGKGYIIVNGGDRIMPGMVSRLTTQLIRDGWAGQNTFLMVMARNTANTTNFALRVAGKMDDVNLVELLESVARPLEGTVSGNMLAADGTIKGDYEERFMGAASEILEQASVEELVTR